MPNDYLPSLVTGGPDRIAACRPLLNGHEVPPGVHHDVAEPIPATVTLRWATGVEQLDTVALEWWRHPQCGSGVVDVVVRVRIADRRVMTGAVWVPASDVRRVSTDTDRPASDRSDARGSRG